MEYPKFNFVGPFGPVSVKMANTEFYYWTVNIKPESIPDVQLIIAGMSWLNVFTGCWCFELFRDQRCLFHFVGFQDDFDTIYARLKENNLLHISS